jgi:hypothetical protein
MFQVLGFIHSARGPRPGRLPLMLLLLGTLTAGGAHFAAAQEAITVGQLLAACKKSAQLCGQALSDNSVSMAYLWAGNCIPSNLTMRDKDLAVLRWLSARPDLAQEDAGDGVADAAVALWPCASTQ